MKPRFVIRSHVRPWGRRWTFILQAGNGEPLAASEPYGSEAAAVEGVRATRRAAALAEGPDQAGGGPAVNGR